MCQPWVERLPSRCCHQDSRPRIRPGTMASGQAAWRGRVAGLPCCRCRVSVLFLVLNPNHIADSSVLPSSLSPPQPHVLAVPGTHSHPPCPALPPHLDAHLCPQATQWSPSPCRAASVVLPSRTKDSGSYGPLVPASDKATRLTRLLLGHGAHGSWDLPSSREHRSAQHGAEPGQCSD